MIIKKSFAFLIMIFSIAILSQYTYAATKQSPSPIGQSAKRDQIETIVFMRHGERPMAILGQLNCQGLNRALALPKVIVKKFGKPDYIFAPNPFAKITNKIGFYYYVTALFSVEPLAIQLGMPINILYAYWQTDETIKAITNAKYHSSLLFVSWEHRSIVTMAKKLIKIYSSANPNIKIPEWSGQDFDSLYVITINWNTTPPKISFVHEHEGLNNGNKYCPTLKHLTTTNKTHAVQTYILIPESESAPGDIDQLSCKGLNRSLALTEKLYWHFPAIDKFILPVPNGVPLNKAQPIKHFFLRAMATLEPSAINSKKDFSVLYPGKIPSLLAQLKQTSVFARTVAIAWPIDDLASLAQAIFAAHGGDPKIIPNPIASVDTIYRIQVFNKSTMPLFTQINENLNNIADTCP